MASKIRAKILDAAVECFATSGYHGCSTKEIAASADVTEGSIFRLFRSKDKLFEEAIFAVIARTITVERWKELLDGANVQEAVMRAGLALVNEVPREYVRISYFASLEEPEIAGATVAPLIDGFINALATRLRLEQKSGAVRREIEPENAARALVLCLYQTRFAGLTISGSLHSLKSQREAVTNSVDIWLNGITN